MVIASGSRCTCGLAAARYAPGTSPIAAPGSLTAHAALEQRRREHRGERESEQAAVGSHRAPVVAREERAQRVGARALAVDAVARAQHERLEPVEHRVAGERAAREREVGGGDPVEAAELQHAVDSEALGAPTRAVEQALELRPGGRAVAEESL